MRKILAGVLALFAFLVVISAPAVAQNNAALTGVVTDASGAVIPDTVVVLTNPHTGVTFTQKTDSKGSYRFPLVSPDPGYVITFDHAGFSKAVVKDVALVVGTTQTHDIQLVAGSAEVVSVDDNATNTINTTDATIGNNFDMKIVDELPIETRSSIATLFTLQAGYGDGSFTGARADQNSVTVDGMDVNNVSNGQNLDIVAGAPVDAVQEFRGTVAGLVSSQGTGSGAQFQLVTRNGTNSFHGNINEYHRDTSTTANTWFNNNVGLKRTPLIRNQFGGSLGGPIIKDKLFFFVDFLNDRIVESVAQNRTVPMLSFINENLNYINSSPGCDGSSRLNTTANCISTISNTSTTVGATTITSLDPLHLGFSAPLDQLLAARYGNLTGGVYDGTSGDGVNTIGYRFNQPEPSTTYAGVGRLDYNLSQHQRIFVRGTVSHIDQTQNANEFLPDPFTSPYTDRSYSYVVSHIWEIGSNKVNQFYYGDTVDEEDFGNLYNPAGTTSLSTSKYIGGFLSGPYSSASTQERRVPVPEFRDDFNITLGKHNLTAGGTFKFVKTNSSLVNDFNFVTVGLSPNTRLSTAQAPGDAYFGDTTSIYDYFGAFNTALGSIAEVDSNYNYNVQGSATTQGQGARRHYRFYQTELYAGDVWKISPKLTLDYGVRYQLYSVPYEANGFESIQNLTYQQLLNARVAQSTAGVYGPGSLPLSTYVLGGKANNGPNTYNPSYKDLAPRVAFSYLALPKTVINASAGIVYDRTVINAVDFIQDQSSQLFQQSITHPYTDGYSNPRLSAILPGQVVPSFPGNAPGTIPHPYTPNIDTTGDVTGVPGAPDGLNLNSFVTNVDHNLKTPYSINFNAGIQQEFPDHFILRLNYVGRMGRRLLAQVDASQLIDFKDTVSGTSLGAAVSNLETQVRAGASPGTVTPIPWFENVVGSGATAFAVDQFASLLQKGDFADFIQGMAADQAMPSNVGLASQFAGDTYVTNLGYSSYNGLLLTLTRNFAQGLQFDFNYTFSHSIDNTSQVANSIASSGGYGFICDALRPRNCRANSDFDETNNVRADFSYDLPVGRHREFASNMPMWLDEIVGGWSVSGIPVFTSGLAMTTSTTSFVAGYANNAPAILIGNKGDLRAHPHKTGNSVFGFTGCGTPNCGNLTSDFAYPTGFTIGSRNSLRTPHAFSMDAGLAKNFILLPNGKLNLKFRADFFNVLNHPLFSAPSTDISQASVAFGQITSTSNSPRVGQFSLRLEY